MNAQMTFAKAYTCSETGICQECRKGMAIFPPLTTGTKPQFCEACYHKRLFQAASINHRQPEPMEGK